MSEEVVLDRKDGILTVMMNREEKRNAMTSTMLARLAEVFRALHDDRDTRVVVIRGAGSSFCSGLDLFEMQEARAANGAVALTEIEEVFHELERVPQATIAMVQGNAIAGGCELALHCDLRVAADNIRMAMPLARLGLIIPLPLIQKLIERAGVGATSEMLFTGEAIRADRVLALNMVNRLVPLADLEESAYQIAQTIAGNAPLSIRGLKHAIFRANAFRRTIEHEDLELERAAAAASEDVSEGLLAMREKRAPRFKGR